MAVKIESSADVSDAAVVGEGCKIWHLAQIREGAIVGENSVIGRGAYVGPGVRIGTNCKLQNYALVYEPAVLGDGVFVGPAVVLTNDVYPRAVTSSGVLKEATDWTPVGVTIGNGASIGARAVCIAPLNIGEWAMIAAGAVVTADVQDYALVAGVPAKRIHWVGKAGVPLVRDGELWECPATGEHYVESDGRLRPVEVAGSVTGGNAG